jgi:SAM-dependent methyltransferase
LGNSPARLLVAPLRGPTAGNVKPGRLLIFVKVSGNVQQDGTMDLNKVNYYMRDLTAIELKLKRHRRYVGGLWDEIGQLQFDFMTSRGLMPGSKLLDVGCGALRGGVHFVRYLDDGNYYGIDINKSLLKAGKQELRQSELGDKRVHLQQTDRFDASGFGVQFDFGISVSLITHLCANQIIFCFLQMRRVMHERSSFFFTFFEVPELPISDDYSQGETITHFLRDPFHYTRDQIEYCALSAGLKPYYIGDWKHPRNQQMLELRLS